MKLLKTLIVLCAFGAASAYAVDPQRIGECSDLQADLEPTAEARERFSMLEGSCEGLYEINGTKYLRAQAVIRRKTRGTVTLFLPATDKTFEVTPEADGRVWVGGRKMRVRDLSRGDKIGIYISVDKFMEKKVDEIALAVPDASADTHTLAALTPAPALPTTASVLPALGMMSGLLFAAGMFMRRFRKTA